MASGEAGQLLTDMLPWLGAFAIVVLVGGVIALGLRRRYNHNQDHASETFSLHELRRLHDSGKLSDQEYANAKSTLLASIRGSDESNPGVEP